MTVSKERATRKRPPNRGFACHEGVQCTIVGRSGTSIGRECLAETQATTDRAFQPLAGLRRRGDQGAMACVATGSSHGPNRFPG